MTVGERVRERRRELGLSQLDLAGPGLSASYISLIESGKRLPGEATLRHLADRLRCQVEFLRDGTDPVERESQALAVAWIELAVSNANAAEALTRADELMDAGKLHPELRWRTIRARATAHELLGDLERAIEDLEMLREQAEAEPKQWPLLAVVIALVRCYREAGDISRSIDLAERALGTADEVGLRESDEQAELAASIVASYYERGDLAHAAFLAKKLIARVTPHGTRRAQAAAYWNASVVAQEHGKVGDALAFAEKALARLSEEDQRRNLARLQLTYAGLLLRVDPPEPVLALDLIQKLRPQLLDSGSVIDLAYADTETARAHLQLGDPAVAMATAEQALSRLGSAPRLEAAQALTVLAQAARRVGNVQLAAQKARQAAQLLALTSSGRQVATAWSHLAEILVQLGERDEALRAYERALSAVGLPAADENRLPRSVSSRA
jgi:tetratricopeptide (TPR) repeat protein